MARIIAQLMEDGRYRYGATIVGRADLTQLFLIEANGGGELPPGPCDPATPEQHERWLASLRRSGFRVEVKPVDDAEA